jgi:pimeloyl-ACP methyl ester carboxylesterase
MWSVRAGSGTPIVFVHGAFCDYRYWEPQIEAFSATHCAVSVSLPGYHPIAGACAPDAITAERHVRDLIAFLEGLGRPAHLVGHSRGGRLALNVAAQASRLLRTVTLFEPGGEMEAGFLAETPAPRGPDVRPTALRQALSGQFDLALQTYIDSGHGEGAWRHAPDIVRRIGPDNVMTLQSMIIDRTAPLSRAQAAQIAVPTLVMSGGQSPASFNKIAGVLMQFIPDVRGVVVEGGDHFANLRKPDAFNRELRSFLAQVGRD